MSARVFRDGRGRRWRVKPRSKREWLFEPLRGNPEATRRAEPPLYAEDPFELSESELRKILASAAPRGGGASGSDRSSSRPASRPPSPFRDDDGPAPGPPPSTFGDEDDEGDEPPPGRSSPFGD